MTIFICHNATDRIRGELTRFLFEIDSGIYIGNLSATVRDLLYEKIEKLSIDQPDFQLLLIYSYKNEQTFLYRYLNFNQYKLVDLDGLALSALSIKNDLC